MRKRSAYRPRQYAITPAYLVAMVKPVTDTASPEITTWCIKNRSAFERILTGKAEAVDVSTLITVNRMTRHAMLITQIGMEYVDVIQRSHAALLALMRRHHTHGTSALKHEERVAFEELLDLHDAIFYDPRFTFARFCETFEASVKELAHEKKHGIPESLCM